ncbi:MAG: hypothetical protein QOF60_1034 [Actinomycetota bacterium]|jgi:hypothetical protein|nr:hypothetical protein [Actinomycetota bacterium]
MRFRKLGLLVAVLAAALGLSPLAAQAQVELPPQLGGDGTGVYVPVAVCVVVGQVHLSDGGAIPDGATFALLGGDNEDEGRGNYAFIGVTVVCVGVITGACTVTSDGTTDNTDGTSGFDGHFNATCVPGQSCDGRVGGPAITQATLGPPPGPPLVGPSGLLDAPWSFTAGPVILGGLDEVHCTAGPLGVPPEFFDYDGIVSLAAAPLFVPVGPNDCEDASAPDITPSLVYCQIEVAGVAVITMEVPGDND